jgi:Fuc2NAc and GlcNAc transferase
MLDIPNERSSHDVPKPTSGGLAIVLNVMAVMLWMGLAGDERIVLFSVLLLLIALVGLADDIKSLGITFRAISYMFLSLMLILFYSNTQEHGLNAWWVISLATLGIFWTINMYNFMDGTDGFAATQLLIVSVPVAIMLYSSELYNFAYLLFILASATLGFLYWNLPPAKIFMGDVGSCSIGFILGGYIYITYENSILSIFIWLILLSVFIVDSTLTLALRLVQGEKWYKAHCDHAYQKYIRLGHSHRQLLNKLIIIGIILLWPCAFLVYYVPQSSVSITVLVYLLVVAGWGYIQFTSKSQK